MIAGDFATTARASGTILIMVELLSALQIRVFLLCALVVFLDGYDLQAMGLAVPALARQWQVTSAAFTIAQTASILGLGLGSAFIAPWGDRLGRRPLLLGGLALIMVTSLGARRPHRPGSWPDGGCWWAWVWASGRAMPRHSPPSMRRWRGAPPS